MHDHRPRINACALARAVLILVSTTVLGCAETGAPGRPAGSMPAPLGASLRVLTDPPGAEVLLDAEPIGHTPVVFENVRPGFHDVTLHKAAYLTWNARPYFAEGGTIDLGTIPLARSGSTIRFWRVGSPQRRDLPSSEFLRAIESHVERLGLRAAITKDLDPGDLAREFLRVVENDPAEIPDVITGQIAMPLTNVVPPDVRADLLWVRGALGIDSVTYLTRRSANHAAARHAAVAFPAGRSCGWASSFTSEPAQRPKTQVSADRMAMAMHAYVGGDAYGVRALSHPATLGTEGRFEPGMPKTVPISARSHGVIGNSRLAFALGSVAYWGENHIGCDDLLSVWIRDGAEWSLLTITGDPNSLLATANQWPRIARLLTEQEQPRAMPATGLAPPDGQRPRPQPGRPFGQFSWTRSPSDGVVAEVLEFNYGPDTRLVASDVGAHAAGPPLFDTARWAWRVWSITRDGRIVFSEVRSSRR